MKRPCFQVGGSFAFRGTPYQYGGFIAPYSGSKYQYGFGLGDILRGVFRTIVPYLLPLASNALHGFLGSFTQSMDQGKSIKEAAKTGLLPAAKSAIQSYARTANRKRLAEQMAAQAPLEEPQVGDEWHDAQSGAGVRKRKRRKIVHKKRVYKGKKRHSKHKTLKKKKKKKSSKSKRKHHFSKLEARLGNF